MKAIEIRVNGIRVVTAGVPDGTVSVSVSRFSPSRGVPDDGAASVRVGALPGEDRPVVAWRVPPLADGDELTVRVVDVEAADPADVDRLGDPAESDAQ